MSMTMVDELTRVHCPAYVLPVEDVFGGVGVGLAVLAPPESGGGGTD